MASPGLSALGSIFGGVAGGAGKLALGAWLTQTASDPVITEHVGRFMYGKETNGKWESLDAKTQDLWKSRASNAILSVGEGVGGQLQTALKVVMAATSKR